MPNEYVNKVEFGNETVMDITDTTAETGDVLEGEVFYAKSGARSVGTLGDATQSAHGLMSAEDKTKLDSLSSYSVMTGATSSTAGVSGLVPAPTTSDVDKFLAGDGTYKDGGKPMVILSYGSSTWNDFINAYNSNVIVYCRASSNSNPATGSQTRMAFMAYVNNATTPTEVEFQYYRSVSSHTASQQGDQVFVYKLTSSGTWTVTTREAMAKIVAGTNMSSTYSNNVLTINGNYSAMTGASSSTAGITGLVPAPSIGDNNKFLKGDGTWDNVSNPQVMTGASSSATGATGLVPAPSAGDESKFLRGDGTWAEGSATVYGNTIDMTSTDSTKISEAIDSKAPVIICDTGKSYRHDDLSDITKITFHGNSYAFKNARYANRKNIAPIENHTYETIGVTVECYNGFIVLNGTGTSTGCTNAVDQTCSIPAGNYKAYIDVDANGATLIAKTFEFVVWYSDDSTQTFDISIATEDVVLDMTFTDDVKRMRIRPGIRQDVVYDDYTFWAGIYPADVTITNTSLTVPSSGTAEYEAAISDAIIDTMQHESVVSYKVDTKEYIDSLQEDPFVYANDFDASLTGKVNTLKTPYVTDDMLFNAIIYNNGTVVQASNYASFVSPLIPISAGTYGLKVVHNSTISNLHTGNSYNNGYGFFASDGTTVISRPSAMQSLGNDIYVFEVPSGAAYLRLCATTSGTTMDICLPYFNQWILLPDANTSITDSFFVVSQKKADGSISKIYRADGSQLTINDTSKATKADTVLTTTLSRGRKSGMSVGTRSFAFGDNVTASGTDSHAEGSNTTASEEQAHAEGRYTIANGYYSHAEGNYTTASGMASHAEGTVTIATHANQHVFGEYNVQDSSSASAISRGNYVEIVGNGTGSDSKSNARTLDWSGNEYLKGDLYVGCNANSSGGTKVIATAFTGASSSAAGAIGLVPAPSSGDQDKVLSGAGTWITIPSVSSKADKVSGATSGNFAGLDANGNLTDSGKTTSDFLGANQGSVNEGKFMRVGATGAVSYEFPIERYSSTSNFPATGDLAKVYIAENTGKTYIWDATDGYVIIGEPHIYYGTCNTAASTEAKNVTVNGRFYSSSSIPDGTILFVFSASANNVTSISLNVNQGGAVAVRKNTTSGSSSNWFKWQNNEVVPFVYYNGYWYCRRVGIMKGATSSSEGEFGLVPTPTNLESTKFLRGDGTWANPSVMTGATSSTAGVSGFIPTPSAGDQDKFLKGDGTWAHVGNGLYTITLDTVTQVTTGTYTHTTTASSITSDLKAVNIECSNPLMFLAPINITTSSDSVTLSCTNVAAGTSTVKVSFLVAGNFNPLASMEYNALDARVGDLSDLTTTDKTDIVSAINEANSRDFALLTPSAPFSIPSVGTPVLYDMEGITENHELIRWNFSNSSENSPPVSLEWTTYNGYFMITNLAGTTEETMRPVFALTTPVTITQHIEEGE